MTDRHQNPAIAEFIDRARKVSFDRAIDLVGLSALVPERGEYQGPCPECGGDDRFAINRGKGVWLCRHCGGGRDAISLIAHCHGWSLKSFGFLEACAALLGEEIPAGGERESDGERAEREARRAKSIEASEADKAKAAAKANRFRDEEIGRARGLWLQATDCGSDQPDAAECANLVASYVYARTGFSPPGGIFDHVRVRRSCGYYHGTDEMRRPVQVFAGPAFILPFVTLERRIVGCHQTWIDLRNPTGKYRPLILNDKGKPLPTKKMRGAKMGALLPICGDMDAKRWVGGEGIENVCAVAGPEGWREDTFYFSSGDLGNLAGPADPKSAFTHPSLKKQDKRGAWRAVKVQGPVPKPDQAPDEAMPVADHVEELILVADGDSEPVWTASCMARAVARLTRPGHAIDVWWPPEGMDFASAMLAAKAGQAPANAADDIEGKA